MIGVLALAILVVNIRQPQIFTVVTSIGIIMIYLAYLGVTAPMLVARLRGRWTPAGEGRFSLGRWGLVVNVVAVVWGAGMTLNLIWPRPAVYNASAPYHWYLRWGAVLFVAMIAGAASPTTGSSSATAPGCWPNTAWRHLCPLPRPTEQGPGELRDRPPPARSSPPPRPPGTRPPTAACTSSSR